MVNSTMCSFVNFKNYCWQISCIIEREVYHFCNILAALDLFSSLSLSITVTETISSRAGEGDDEEQALLERLAKREERRQRRMKEALDRQKQLESTDAPSYSSYSVESSYTTSYQAVNNQEEEPAFNSKEEVKEEVEIIPQKGVEEEKPCRPSLREQVCFCVNHGHVHAAAGISS